MSTAKPRNAEGTVSVSGAAYERMQRAARERGISVAELVRLACADILEQPA